MADKFQEPTPEEVTVYAQSIDFKLNGQYFCDFYESKGWKVGHTPMKSWKAAVRTWKARGSRNDGSGSNKVGATGGFKPTKPSI